MKRLFITQQVIRFFVTFFFLCTVLITLSTAGASLPKTQRLKESIRTHISQSGRLLQNLNSWKASLEQTKAVMEAPADLGKVLTKTNNTLGTTTKLLAPLLAIPKVGTVVSLIHKALKLARTTIRPVKNLTATLTKVLKLPKRDVNRMIRDTEKVKGKLVEFCSTALQAQRKLRGAESCIRDARHGGQRQHLSNTLEGFARNARPSVDTLNTLMMLANRSVERASTDRNKVKSIALRTKSLARLFHNMLPALNKIDNIFSKIRGTLNHRIGVPYRFKVRVPFKVRVKVRTRVRVRARVRVRVKVRTWKLWKWKVSFQWKRKWKWQWKWKTSFQMVTKWKNVVNVRYFSFTVSQILKGVNTGIRSVNKRLMGLAMTAIEPLLEELEGQVLKVPNLVRMTRLIKQLRNLTTGLAGTLDPLSSKLHHIQSKAPQLDNKFNRFPMICR